MPVLLRPVNNFLGQVRENASEGKYNTVNNSSSGEVTFQKCLISGITLISSKNSNKSQNIRHWGIPEARRSVAPGTRVPHLSRRLDDLWFSQKKWSISVLNLHV